MFLGFLPSSFVAGRRLWPQIAPILRVSMSSTRNYHLLAFEDPNKDMMTVALSLCLFVSAVWWLVVFDDHRQGQERANTLR